jgi:hypothetical protein
MLEKKHKQEADVRLRDRCRDPDTVDTAPPVSLAVQPGDPKTRDGGGGSSAAGDRR